jgi:hypothetical protein
MSKPHDSHFVYQIVHKRVFKSALPGLGGKKNSGEILFLIVLIFLAMFGGIAAGFQIDQHFINPPTQLIGVCSPPAQMVKGGCYIVTPVTNSNGKITYTYTPSGTLYLINGTGYRG